MLAAAALAAAFVAVERRTPHPLDPPGHPAVLARCVRANLGAMTVAGGWFAFQFVGTLYLQQLRGWSAIEMAVAFLPGGLLVAVGAPRSGELVDRFGATRVTAVGMAAFVGAYALFLPIGADSPYLTAMLPTMLLAGVGFMCSFGPLNVAATSGVADHEQGLASGLVQSSLQLGGAVGLAVATAVIDAGTTRSASAPGSSAAMLDGFHPALLVSLIVAALGLTVTVSGLVPGLLRAVILTASGRPWRTSDERLRPGAPGERVALRAAPPGPARGPGGAAGGREGRWGAAQAARPRTRGSAPSRTERRRAAAWRPERWTWRRRSASRRTRSAVGRNGSATTWPSSSEIAAHAAPSTSASRTAPRGARRESSAARRSSAMASPAVARRMVTAGWMVGMSGSSVRSEDALNGPPRRPAAHRPHWSDLGGPMPSVAGHVPLPDRAAAPRRWAWAFPRPVP